MKKEDIKQMKERHEKEIKELQENCKHKKVTDWLDMWWAPGHSTGSKVKVCKFCGMIVKKKSPFKHLIK